mgnify:CR=1 FL=1
MPVEVGVVLIGAGFAVGLYGYLEGYEGWDSLLAQGDEYRLVCSGLDLALLWDVGGPLHGCGIWKGGKQIGAYHGTWRGGGLNARLLLWGYKCRVKHVRGPEADAPLQPATESRSRASTRHG